MSIFNNPSNQDEVKPADEPKPADTSAAFSDEPATPEDKPADS